MSNSIAASEGSVSSGRGWASRRQPVGRRLVMTYRPVAMPSTGARSRGEAASSSTRSQSWWACSQLRAHSARSVLVAAASW
ncbi:hypothetical protein LUW75_09655 [Streptomyces sp. MRC013]|nr:hypothetical protein [Streptomyces sp. MRC013]URM90210.1 hypothetical protein LUW75_09655 [Streptomyces sp. MRC013]